ncbi:MAG: cytochrome c3 family protein [bacterium]
MDVFIVIFSILFFFTVFPAAAMGNSCIGCHSKLDQKMAGGKAFYNWKDSVHDKAGVTCDRCHGGNPAAGVPGKAHAGVLKPADPGSKVHMSNVPTLCGECHQTQWKEFTFSSHYKALISYGGKIPGPTCITCHGSMHTAILSPDNVAEACRRCHNPESRLSPNIPVEAHATLDLIFYAKNTVKWSGEFVTLAREKGYPVTDAAAALKQAEEKFRLAEIKWHSFDFHEILKLVDESYEAAKKAKRLADLELSEKPGKP